jgi:ribonucleoside-diphosphate reductase alpha chain
MQEAKAKRRIGLGITGLADALIMLGVRYGSDTALAQMEHWLTLMSHTAYLTSAQIAAEKGAFPLFNRENLLAHPRIAALPAAIKDEIAAHGLRNGLLTSIAPTGTISLLAGNVSSGIEPVFSYKYRRRILAADGSERFEDVEDSAHRLYRERFGDEAPLTPAFVDAQMLTPEDHLRMQAAAQKHIDSAISKTINVPREMPFDAFKDIYARAYALGCKGCTTYRPTEARGAVLSAEPAEQQEGEICPRCGAHRLFHQEGCATCLNCGYSKCS